MTSPRQHRRRGGRTTPPRPTLVAATKAAARRIGCTCEPRAVVIHRGRGAATVDLFHSDPCLYVNPDPALLLGLIYQEHP